MGDDYMESQDSVMNELQNRPSELSEPSVADPAKDYGDMMGFDDGNYDDEDGNNFRGNRGRGNFRSVASQGHVFCVRGMYRHNVYVKSTTQNSL